MPDDIRLDERSLSIPMSFGARLARAFSAYGQLCVGIDPHQFLLHEWGLTDTADSLREFGLRVVDAAFGQVGVVKPQVAFFERHGAAGFAALESVVTHARDCGLLVIADVKRGDIGSTVEAYTQAWLAPGSALESDAMTVSAFQGVGSLSESIEFAALHGKGLFVLAATSNPESETTQTATIARGNLLGKTVAAGIVEEVVNLNRISFETAGIDHNSSGLASLGLVLGATVDFTEYGIPMEKVAGTPATPVLAPGFGFQGTPFSELVTRYGAAARCVIVTSARGVLAAGPVGVRDEIARQAEELSTCLA